MRLFGKKKSKPKSQTSPAILEAEKTRYEKQFLGRFYPDPHRLTIPILKKMDSDSTVQFAKQFIVSPLVRIKPQIARSSGDSEIDSFIMESLDIFWQELIERAFDEIIPFGFAAFEKLWRYDERTGRVIISRMKDLDPELTRINSTNGHFKGVTYNSDPAQTITPEYCLVITREKRYGNFYGESGYKVIYDAWFRKNQILQYWCRYLERHGNGVPIIRYPTVKPSDVSEEETESREDKAKRLTLANQRKALSVRKAFVEGGAVALPSERYMETDDAGFERMTNTPKWDVTLLEDRGRGEEFKELLQYLDVQIIRGMLIPEQAIIQTGVGTYAEAKQKYQLFLLSLEQYQELFIRHINRYVIPDIVRFNFGEKQTPPLVSTAGVETDKLELLREVVLEIIRKDRFTGSDWEINRRRLMELFGLPIKETLKKGEK